jgi:MFS family permease
MQLWILALATTLGMQSVASFLNQSLSIIAPLLMAGAGLAPERIGNISSLNSLGTIGFLLFGGPVLAHLGPVRALQMGALLASAGLLAAASGWWPALALAALLMGAGYGPSPPAGSRILAATAPPRHRSLIFSVKQAGAPAGGALAGIILAPAAARWGWSAALLISVGVGVAAAIAIAPARRRLDIEKATDQPFTLRGLFAWRALSGPFRLLAANPVLLSVTALAFSFAIVQGALFTFSVTYLVTALRMPLTQAGIAYACMQCAGVFARIFLGWMADRTGRPVLNLALQALVAAVAVAVFAALPDRPPTWLAACAALAAGFFGASWNGIYMAEIARQSPAEQIAEATSSSAVVTFLGYVAGPSLFSALVTLTGGWAWPFLAVAGQLAAMAAVQLAILARVRAI